MESSYKNPFSGGNAVQLSIDKILEYWCDPSYPELTGKVIFETINNIVLMGGRSTGKSMLLRYWSHEVQKNVAERDGKTIYTVSKENGGVGFYFRIDGAKLKSFQGFGFDETYWTALFTHYLELRIGREYLEFLKSVLENSQEIIEISKLLYKLGALLNEEEYTSLDSLIKTFDDKIRYVDRYLGEVPFHLNRFGDDVVTYGSRQFSFEIPELIKTYLPDFENVKILILLDEYENFLEFQQKTINTLLKFSNHNVKFVVAMRLEGFKTFSTVSDTEFIQESREYRKVLLEEVVTKIGNKSTGYANFLYDVANKRLESIPLLKEKGFTDIKNILGYKDQLELDAKKLVANDQQHKIYERYKDIIDWNDFNRLKHDNPLITLLNCTWILRRRTIEVTLSAMQNFLSGGKLSENGELSEYGRKYKLDYQSKYKLSLSYILHSIYHRNKEYYSFSTFVLLSSGIIGNFIELCSRTFAISEWSNDKLLELGEIESSIQSKAASEVSVSASEQIPRIETYGRQINNFVNNVGAIFWHSYRDFKMKYPETNQFSLNINSIKDDELRKVITTAIKWSVIQKKGKPQRVTPNTKRKDIYILNRIFSPFYHISHRTRGGFSLEFDEGKLRKLIYENDIDPKEFLPRERVSQDRRTKVVKDSFQLFA